MPILLFYDVKNLIGFYLETPTLYVQCNIQILREIQWRKLQYVNITFDINYYAYYLTPKSRIA